MNANSKRNSVLYAAARSLAVVSAVFSIAVATLLVMDFVRRDAAPLQESPTLDKLRSDLREAPKNVGLKEEIRGLDTVARRDFFTSVNFATNGAILLCVGLLALAGSLKWMVAVRKRLPDPGKFSADEDVGGEGGLGRKAVAVTALVMIAICVGVAVTVRSGLERIESVEPTYAPSEAEIRKNWPGFRGPYGIGVAHCTNVPVQWDTETGENVRWKVEVPLKGFSSPVVWEKHIFLTSADRKTLSVFCYNTEDGKLRWRCDVPESETTGKRPKVTEDTGYAAATMATDGRHAFAIFATGDLLCTDFDGNIVWSRNIGVPINPYGHASSLITHSGLVFVQYDEKENPRLIALEVDTGRTRWKTSRKVQDSWASPIIIDNEGSKEIVLNALPMVAGYELATGKEKWSTNCMDGEVAPSPAFAGGIVYVTTEYSILAAIEPGPPVKILWEYDEDLPSVSSPVAIGEYLFVADGGVVNCFGSKTGKLLWQQEYNTGFYSSPIYAEGRIYLVDEDGLMRVIAADKAYKLLASCQLSGRSVCTPAFMDGRIYIRGNKTLSCIEK
jgi:outer membrane protein assembly factor BamB